MEATLALDQTRSIVIKHAEKRFIYRFRRITDDDGAGVGARERDVRQRSAADAAHQLVRARTIVQPLALNVALRLGALQVSLCLRGVSAGDRHREARGHHALVGGAGADRAL